MPKYITAYFEENFTFFQQVLFLGTKFLWLHHNDNLTIILLIFSQNLIKPELLDLVLKKSMYESDLIDYSQILKLLDLFHPHVHKKMSVTSLTQILNSVLTFTNRNSTSFFNSLNQCSNYAGARGSRAPIEWGLAPMKATK